MILQNFEGPYSGQNEHWISGQNEHIMCYVHSAPIFILPEIYFVQQIHV